MDRNRAISDVLGFTLVFSIVLLSVGVVTAGGFSALTELTDRQQVENADRGMSAVAVTFDSLHRNGDTYREPSLTLGDAKISLNRTQLNITSTNPAFNNEIDAKLPDGGNITVNALEHRFERPGGDIVIVYEAGAVFRTTSASPRYGPSFQCRSGPDGETRAIISIVNISAGDRIIESDTGRDRINIQPTSLPDGSLTSTDNSQIDFEAERIDSARIVNDSFSGEVAADVTGTAEPSQWERYFSNPENEWTTGGSAGTYSCDADSVLVRVTTIELSVVERLSN